MTSFISQLCSDITIVVNDPLSFAFEHLPAYLSVGNNERIKFCFDGLVIGFQHFIATINFCILIP